MRLLPADEIEASSVSRDPPRCQVALAGAPPVRLNGWAVLAALALGPDGPVPDGHIVLTDDGVPFEEMVHVQLIDATGRMLDHVSIGGAYQTGMLEQLRLQSDDTFAFRFIVDWQVTVLATPRWRLPIPQRGVWRDRPLRSWLVVAEAG